MVMCFNLLFLGAFNDADKAISLSSAVTIVLIILFVFRTLAIILRSILYIFSCVTLEHSLVVPRMKFFIAVIAEIRLVI